jgi:hypothetical protein
VKREEIVLIVIFVGDMKRYGVRLLVSSLEICISGVHRNSKGVLHYTSRAVTSVGFFVGNQCSKELWSWITLTRKE